MAKKGFIRNFAPLDILTEEQVESINKGTLQVLQETGIRIEHEGALKLLKENGCKVDSDRRIAKIPPGLVHECINKCPSSFMVETREPTDNVVIGGNVSYFKNSCGMQTIDLETWEPKEPTREDNYDAITILDYLENLHILGPFTAYFGFEGVKPVMAMPESCAAKIRNSTKVQIEGYSNDSEIFQIQMAKAVGSEIFQQILGSAPLTWYGEGIEALFRAEEAGFPVTIIPGQTTGATAPATLAGALITNNATLDALLVLAQLKKPGARILPAIFDFPMNMRSGSPGFGGIESSLLLAGFNQIWRGYGLPRYNATSGYSSSKRMDFQSGYEKTIQCVIAGLSGANLMGLYGAVSAELTFHPIQAIMDDDLAGMIGRFLRGYLLDDETLALDLINRVGPIPGHFVGEEHTRKWWKRESFIPKVADRLSYPEWIEKGKPTVLENAIKRMNEIIDAHHAKPLSAGQEEDIERILDDARKYYKKQGKL